MPRTALELLRLLAADAPAEQIEEKARALAAEDPDDGEAARELALRVRAGLDAHRRREAELSALVDTARDLASLPDPGGVLDAIVRRARTLLRADVAYLTLFDPDRGDTYMRATAGSVSARFQALRLPLGAGLGGLVAQTRRPYWSADYPADEQFRHTSEIDAAVDEEGLIGICGTPLLVGDEFVGRAVRVAPHPPRVPPRRGGAAGLAGRARRGVAGPVPPGRRDGRRPSPPCPRRTRASPRQPRRTTASSAWSSPAAGSTTSRECSARCWRAGWRCSTPTGAGSRRTGRCRAGPGPTVPRT